MRVTTEGFDCPWPGPAPYREEDAVRFFGRALEEEQLIDLISHHRLNILTALSGVGKSSLIQAGLIPALRDLREDGQSIGTVLILREWALLSEGVPAAVLIEAFGRSIDALRKSPIRLSKSRKKLARDSELLASVERPDVMTVANDPHEALVSLTRYVRSLCDKVGGLVVILDQAEELLGSGLGTPDQDLEREVLGVIALLFKSEPRLRLLLSLREEYQGRLTPLARHVEGLDRRIFRLNPMPRQAISDVVLKSAATARVVKIGERQVETILSWLTRVEKEEGRGFTECPVDLLRMQVLLVAVFAHAKRLHGTRSGKVNITDAILMDFQGEAKPEQLAREALEVHLAALFETAELPAPPHGPGRHFVRRVVARMARWLSSAGGFKRHVSGDELIYNSLREEFEVLGIEGDDLRQALKKFLEAKGTAKLEIVFQEPPRSERSTYVSSDSLTHDWTLAETATMIAKAGLDALMLLCRRQILKSTRGGGITTYELVHDGFGPALIEWADKERKEAGDALASFVSRRGETFRWEGEITPGTLPFKNLSWFGCSIKGVKMKGIRFVHCMLKGTIFIDCELTDCVFLDCDLDGTVFRGGNWTGVRFEETTVRSALFLDIVFGQLEFVSSRLDGSYFMGVTLKGRSRVEDSNLRFAQISAFLSGDNAEIKFLRCDARNAFYGGDPGDFVNSETTGVMYKPIDALAPRSGKLSVFGR